MIGVRKLAYQDGDDARVLYKEILLEIVGIGWQIPVIPSFCGSLRGRKNVHVS